MRQQDYDIMRSQRDEFIARGDSSSAAQMSALIKYNKVLDSRLTQGQKASYSKIGKKIVGKMHDASERWGSTPGQYSALWSAYAKTEVQKLLLRGSTQKKALERATEILHRHSNDFWNGNERMPPTASKSYFLCTVRPSDEERYARSSGRGSNASAMRGLGLRNASAPASSGGVAAAKPAKSPVLGSNPGPKPNPNKAEPRRSKDAATYLRA